MNAALTKSIAIGVEAAFAEVNDSGGIHGRELIARIEDDGSNDANVALASAKSLEKRTFGIGTMSSFATYVLYGYLEQRKIPHIYNNLSRSIAQKLRYGFPSTVLFDTVAQITPSFIAAKFGANKKIGMIIEDTPAYNSILDEFRRAASRKGLKIVSLDRLQPNPQTCFNEVTKAQQAGAEVIFAGVLGLSIGCLLRDSEAANYHPIWTGVGWANANVINTGSGCRTEGIINPGIFHTLSDSRGQKYSAAVRKYFPDEPRAADDDTGAIGWAVAQVFIAGLRKAGPNPTRESFVAAMETMRDFDSGSFWGAPLTFAPNQRLGGRGILTIQVRNCRWVTMDEKWRASF